MVDNTYWQESPYKDTLKRLELGWGVGAIYTSIEDQTLALAAQAVFSN